ncbi:MAG: 2,3-bisphosphoglycerate-independent phosphoglycerate mutase [Thermodesulfobacteriota bacterium]
MQEVIGELVSSNTTKMVLCVLDGLGGLPLGGKTELEAASTPNLDEIARGSATGLHIPVAPGITPGSGAAHLALFGYDPLKYGIGRGVLEALGLGVEVTRNDIAVRGNFATVEYKDDKPILADRRAGRISTEENRRIATKIREAVSEIDGVGVSIHSGVEHRFALVLTFPEPLRTGSDEVSDTDPQVVECGPLQPTPRTEAAEPVARIIEQFITMATEAIRDEEKANYLLLRGISRLPDLLSWRELYGVSAGAVAAYPMYRGIAKLVGMDVLEVDGTTIESEIETLEKHIGGYDFIYLHVKKTDSYGEDGDFEGKVGVIEEFDGYVQRILQLKPDVLVVTGDHSTPSVMKSHSWHPVPFLLKSRLTLGGKSSGFSERECLNGELGVFRAVDAMTLMLAHAGRLQKFGA